MLFRSQVVIVLFFVLIVQLILAVRAVKFFQVETGLTNAFESGPGWGEYETRRLKKDIFWLEQVLALEKSDSVSITLNLKDSLVSMRLKGVELLQTKILKQVPSGFLETAGELSYKHFAGITYIVKEEAGIPKRAVKKQTVIQNKEETENKKERNSTKPLTWSFTTSNNLKVIINGVVSESDSLLCVHPVKDLMKNRIQEFLSNPLSKEYIPILHLWIDDNDAKSLYRAVPSGGTVLFRN